MKIILLYLSLILSSATLNAQIIISGVIDGPLTGGIPKAIEFYVYENIPDLSIFGFGSANNGGGSDGEEFTFPAVSVSSGTYIYVSSETTGFNNFFGFNPDYTSSAASINGDDAIELFKNGSVFDVFGDINTDGTGQPWEYMDGWAYRNDQTGPDGSTFIIANWSFSGKNALDGETSNSTAATPFPIGTYNYALSIPNAPVATSATDITHESFTANWNVVTGASTYFLDVSESSNFSSFVAGYDNLNVGNINNTSVTGLSSSTDYYYRVRANNSAGTSGNSNIITVTTDVMPLTTIQFYSNSGSVTENGGSYNLVVTISNPDANNPTFADVVLITGDPADIENYTTQTVTFPAGSSDNQIVALTITDDGITEGNETLTFELQNITGGNTASAGTPSQFGLTIIETSSGNYYDNIDPSLTTFVDDLKNRIRYPYTHVPYSQFDETNIANFASKDNGDGTKSVFCVYSNYEYVYSGTFTWDVLSREHTFPHSWMPTNPADNPVERDEYSDQHHLFPTNQDNANAIRSNHPLGNVVTVTDAYFEAKFGTDANGNTVYEPRNEHKGDAARAILYMALRYDDIDGYDWGFNSVNTHIVNDLGRDPQDINTLLSWHQQDPPDQWELDRNDYVQSIQGNRNPFVDHPEYVSYIDFYTMEYVSKDLFFSEYVEGSSNNKALEIFNNTGSDIDLSTAGYKVEIFSNGSSTSSSTISLSGTLVDGDVYVVANSSADASILAVTDLTTGSINFNGNDAVALVKGTATVDVIGQIGFDPGTEWGTGDISTKDNTIRRRSSIGAGDPDGSDVFDPSVEWIGFASDTFDGLGTHAVNAGAPTIANVARTPKIPTEVENTTVSADVTDDASVGIVKLKYSIDGGVEQEVSMSNTTGSTYQGVIPNSAYTNGSLLEYWIYSEDGDGASSVSSHHKVFTGTTPIANLHSVDADGRLLHIQTYARISGVATVASGTFSPTNLDIYLQDNTGGINIFKYGTITTIIKENSYLIEGILDQYNGKAEIIPDDLAQNIIDNGAAQLPDTLIITLSNLLLAPETYEGQLIGIQHLTNTGGEVWPVVDNDANISVSDDGGTNTITLRIDKDTDIDGTSEPIWPRDIIGIFGQFDNAPPYNWGYQIQPRSTNDILEDGVLPVELISFTATAMTKGIMLNWSTATEVNNYGFSVERKSSFAPENKSEDFFHNWQEIGFVEGHGNSNSPKDYSFLDNDLISGEVSYRLKQIDTDGKFEYSNVVTVTSKMLAKDELYQNYPNPFNPSTIVSFSLPEMSHVKLTVYNAIGQEVAKLLDKQIEAGYYNVTFDGSNLASGLYIYRLETPNYSKTMKMMLLR